MVLPTNIIWFPNGQSATNHNGAETRYYHSVSSYDPKSLRKYPASIWSNFFTFDLIKLILFQTQHGLHYTCRTVTQEDETPKKEGICGFRREAYKYTTDIVWAVNLFFLRLCPIFRQKIAYGTCKLRHGSYKLQRQSYQYGDDPIASIALYKPLKSSTEGYLRKTSSLLEKGNVITLKSLTEEYLWATNSPLREQTLTVRIFIRSIYENDSFFLPYGSEQRSDGSKLWLELRELLWSMQ